MMVMKTLISFFQVTVLSIILVPLLVGCNRNPTLVEVGSVQIGKKDVEMRRRAMSVFSPQLSQKIALEQLIRSYTLSELLKKKGVNNLDASVEQEAKRFTESGKSNPKIAQVRKVFGSDEQTFRKVFILPMLADRVAYMDGYLKDSEFHKTQKQKADDFLTEVQKNPKGFEALAKKNGYVLKKGWLDSEKGLLWEPPREPASSNLPGGTFIADQWKRSVLNQLDPGKIASTFIEQGNAWVLLKKIGLSSSSKGSTEIAAVVVVREPFNVWIEKNRGLVPVTRISEQKLDSQ